MLNKVIVRVLFDRKNEATTVLAVGARQGSVQIQVTANGKRRFVFTGVKIYKGQWQAGHVIIRPDAMELNDSIDRCTKAILDMVATCDRENRMFSVSMLDSMFFKTAQHGCSFIDFFKKRMYEKNIAPGTLMQHRKILNFLVKYNRLNDFSQITKAEIQDLDDFLRNKIVAGQQIKATSVYSYHKIIKCYINDAVAHDLMKANPYAGLKLARGNSRQRQVLTIEEVRMIENYKTLSVLQAKVRDLFIVQCYTGLAYVDLFEVDFSTAENDVIKSCRHKTNIPFIIYLLPPVKAILKRYNGKLPFLAYDVYRRWLKAVSVAAGITKDISTHTGRHTFATTIAMQNGIPIEIISRMLGHSDIRTTQIYAKVQRSMVEEQGKIIARKLAL